MHCLPRLSRAAIPFSFAFAGVLLAGCGAKEPTAPPAAPRMVRLFTAAGGEARGERVYAGAVRAAQRIELSFRVGGPLVALGVSEGAQVEAGQTLAKIDPRDYENKLNAVSSSLESAQAQLKAMQSGARPEDIRKLEAAVQAATANYNKADTDFMRSGEMLKERIIAQSDFDMAQRNVELAKANLDSAKAALDAGRSGSRSEDIEAMQAQIRGFEAQKADAQHALDDTVLTAPFAGAIAARLVENHVTVRAGETVLILQDNRTVDVAIQIPERDMARAPKEARAESLKNLTAIFDAYPDKPLPVTLKEFKTEADSATQTFEVIFSVTPDSDMNVKAGMTASVRVELNAANAAGAGIVVPADAVFQAEDGNPYVWVVDRQKMIVSRRAVVPKTLRATGVELESGLEPGETVAATGVNHLREGMAVRALDVAGRTS